MMGGGRRRRLWIRWKGWRRFDIIDTDFGLIFYIFSNFLLLKLQTKIIIPINLNYFTLRLYQFQYPFNKNNNPSPNPKLILSHPLILNK
jgi:hypothetical protein